MRAKTENMTTIIDTCEKFGLELEKIGRGEARASDCSALCRKLRAAPADIDEQLFETLGLHGWEVLNLYLDFGTNSH